MTDRSVIVQDPTDESGRTWLVGAATDPVFGIVSQGAQVLQNVHLEAACTGPACWLHRPSAHHMRDWPVLWRADRGQLERACEHGVGHLDPDQDLSDWRGVHGCDGCCRL